MNAMIHIVRNQKQNINFTESCYVHKLQKDSMKVGK